jgi:hypothetical protein
MAERQHLEREIARVGDEERRRLGHDLHDGVSQQLAGALLRCAALEERLSHEQSAGADDARALGELLESALEESQEVARGLCPVDMHPEALGPALRALSRRAGATFRLRCEYRAEGDAGLRGSESTLHLYRIAQEAVSNAGKHARASRITITLGGCEDAVLLEVEDDGTGLPASASGGLGLRIMDYRARLTYDLSQLVDGINQRITGLIVDFQGRYWLNMGTSASIYVLNPATAAYPFLDLPRVNLSDGEVTRNGMAVTKEGAYVVTTKKMYRVDAGPDDQPYVVWSTHRAEWRDVQRPVCPTPPAPPPSGRPAAPCRPRPPATARAATPLPARTRARCSHGDARLASDRRRGS